MMILNKDINQQEIIQVIINKLNNNKMNTIKNNEKLNVKPINTESMTNLNNGVDIQGIGNTIDLKTVMNLYTSSFTDGFMKVLENYNTPLQEFVIGEKKVKTTTIQKPKSKPKNKGFEKLKNPLLREKLQKGKKVKFNPKTHIRVKDLGYKSIYVLDSMSKKKWNEYFLKGKVYLNQDVNTSRISKTILFDKSITKFFGKKDTPK